MIIPRGLSRAIHSQLNGSPRLLFETRRRRDCWQTEKPNIRLFVCCKLSRRKLNSARLTSLKWHRYHNWSYSLTRFRDISQAAKYLNISEYNFYSCCWQLSNTSMDSGRCKAYCKTEEKNGKCERGKPRFCCNSERRSWREETPARLSCSSSNFWAKCWSWIPG